MDIKENAKNIDVWTRGLFILIYAVIFYFLFGLIWLVVIFQFFIKLITGQLNRPLLDFSDSLNRYVSQILLYVTFKSEQRPFPFSPWPGGDPAEAEAPQIGRAKTGRKKTGKKKTAKKETAGDQDR